MTARSIKRSLIARTLVALGVIGIAGAVASYALGYRYATLAYDRALLDDVETLADQVTLKDGRVIVNLPPAAQKWLLANEGERVIWQVIDLNDGSIVDGNGSLGAWNSEDVRGDQPHYRDTRIDGISFRVAYVRKNVDPTDHPVLVEIGETRGKRVRMASSILLLSMVVMATMVAAAAALIWGGVVNALMPLRELEREVGGRSSTNLKPLAPELAPEEVRGLVTSINHMMSRLTHTIESQRRFTANAAHQLRTPIAGLKLQAQILHKELTQDRHKSHVAEIEHEAARIAHLIDQLLILAKAESDDFALSHDHVDLVAMCHTVIERFLPQAIAKNIDLGFEGARQPILFDGNETLLAEMLGNLVDNAIRYSLPNGGVTVSIDRVDRDIVLRVSDNGPGVPWDEKDKLFERLYRSDSSRQMDGAGLGLAIVKEIADRYGAVLEVAPAIGGGSIFSVKFRAEGGL